MVCEVIKSKSIDTEENGVEPFGKKEKRKAMEIVERGSE